MKWILVGYMLNTLLAQSFDTREACEGRAVLLREAKATAKCVELVTSQGTSLTTGHWQFNSTLGVQ